MVYSSTALFVFSCPAVAHRIQREALEDLVDVNASVAEPLQTLEALPQGAGDAVDWRFMTDRFSWAGREQTTYDVVEGHACQGGYYDNSYYATSLCYWHPESQHNAPQTWGLRWRGGYGPGEWCGEIGMQSGVCARCSVCHDNARDRDAHVDKAEARVEIIPLPECMKEGAIETACLQDFEANNAGLLGEESRCREVQGRYDQAVSAFNQVNQQIQTSEHAISELMNNVGNAHQQVSHWRNQRREARQQVNVAGRRAGRRCRRFGVRDHHSNRDIVRMAPRCVAPTTPAPPAAVAVPPDAGMGMGMNRMGMGMGMNRMGMNMGMGMGSDDDDDDSLMEVSERVLEGDELDDYEGDELDDYEEDELDDYEDDEEEGPQEEYDRCQRCSNHVDVLRRTLRERDHANEELERWEHNIVNYEQEMVNHRAALAQAYQALPGATGYKQAMEAEWFPQQQACEQVYVSSANARNAHMMICPQRFYDQSCEKACVEIQRSGDHGCGVIEGSQDGDAFAKGGVEVTCSPPAASWIMSPSNYGGNPNPDSGEICSRMMPEQAVRVTTPVLMSGWLEKSCYRWCWGADRRFFVLESGNGVRSANLRYYGGDPAQGASEHTNKGIIMWDAAEVTVGETSHTQACFELTHHYRGRTQSWLRRGTSYTICVTREEYPQANINELRDQWVNTLQQTLVWHPRVA